MKKASVRKAFVLGILMTLVLIAGCAGSAGINPGASSHQTAAQDSPRTVAYKSLATMNKTYNAVMKSLGDLYRQKLIDEQIKARAIEYGTAFQRAYNMALDAAENDDFGSISGVSVALAELLDYVQPYLVKEGKQ